MLSFLKRLPLVSIPLSVGILTLLFLYMVRGPLVSYPDTKVYLGQIAYAKGEVVADMDIELRSFKPLYGVVGSWLSKVVSPEVAILIINLFFFFGLIISSYYLLKEIGFEELYAAIGASWVATGYPLLKYGLALLTDISGWFFAAATIAIFLIGLRKNSTWMLVISSVVAFLGSLCKETGILGLLFAGLYLLIFFVRTRKLPYLAKLAVISLPFILLQGLFLSYLFTKSDTHTSFIQWFFFNKDNVGYELHTLYYFVLTELSTFSLLWFYSVVGVCVAWKYRTLITKEQLIIAVCLFAAVLPPLIWPVFLTRVLYIGYLLVVPLALVGLCYWQYKNPSKRKTFLLLSILPIISSVGLFFLAGGRSLFPLIERLL